MAWPKPSAFKITLVLGLLTPMGDTSASVVIANSRVIYPGSAQEKNVQLTNQDDTPSVMQVWLDAGNPNSTPETADAPFVAMPPVFRIGPNAGQTVRIVFIGKELPQDRESLFYFNTFQIPPMNPAYAGQNQLLVMLRNRLKLFYRPASLEGGAQKALEQLSFRLRQDGRDWHITAKNPSGYYISFMHGRVTSGSRTTAFVPDMLAPRAEANWSVKDALPQDGAALRVKVSYIDDFGAVRNADYPVTVEQGSH